MVKKRLPRGWVVSSGILLVLIVRTSTAFSNLCLADLNSDGRVGLQDLLLMNKEMGRDNCFTASCTADLNGDGKVNNEDEKILKDQYGRNDCLSSNGEAPGEQIEIPHIGQETEFVTGEGEAEIHFDSGEGNKTEEGAEPLSSRFKDNGDGTVSDPNTGLVWTKDANLPGDTMLFHQALDYIEEMNEGKHPNLGYADWRLPTLHELRSLIDYTKFTSEGHILPDGHPFANIQSLNFNSGTSPSYLSNSDHSLFISLYCRLVGHNVITCYGYVWPVRGRQESGQ